MVLRGHTHLVVGRRGASDDQQGVPEICVVLLVVDVTPIGRDVSLAEARHAVDAPVSPDAAPWDMQMFEVIVKSLKCTSPNGSLSAVSSCAL